MTRALLATPLLFLATGCGSTAAVDAPVCLIRSLSVTPIAVVSTVGDSTRLSVSPPPCTDATATFLWISTESSVATVEARERRTAVVIGRTVGTAIVTGSLSSDPDVTVAVAVRILSP